MGEMIEKQLNAHHTDSILQPTVKVVFTEFVKMSLIIQLMKIVGYR